MRDRKGQNEYREKLEVWKENALGVGWGVGVDERRKGHGFGLGTIEDRDV